MTILADEIRHLCKDLSIMLGAKVLQGPDLMRAIGMVGRHKASPAYVPPPKLMRRLVEAWKAEALRDDDAPSWPYDAGHTDPRGREEWPGGIGE